MINTTAQNALKNSVYNFIGFILPIVILIFFTPIIISKLGVKEYGIYIFLNTILAFLGLLDLGVSVANSKHIIEYSSTGQDNKLKKLVYSMNSVYSILAFVYLFVCIGIGFIVQAFFLKPGTHDNFLVLFLIVGLTVFVSTIFYNFAGIITTTQRYDLYLKISMSLVVLSNLSMLILVSLGYGLDLVLISQLFLIFLANLAYYRQGKKIFPVMRFKYAWDKEEILKNYKFGLSVAFNNLASSSLVHFDKLLVPIFLGGAQLTYYSVPGSVATKVSSISGTFSSLLFPITVNLHALNNIDKIKRVYIRSVRLIAILSSAMALSIIFTADKVLFYWLDASFVSQSVGVLVLLVLTNFILALFSPLSNLLMATNRMKFLTMGSFVMAGINIVTLFIFLPRYGINGAAWSYLISVLFIFFMFYHAERKYFMIDENVHLKLLIKLILTAIPFFVLVKFLFYPMITSFLTLAIIGPACVLLFLVLYKLFGFVELEDWNDFKFFFAKSLIRLRLKRV